MSPELVKKIKESTIFPELQEYIVDKILELESLHGVEGMTNENAGEEIKVRSKAARKLKEILSPFIEYRERPEPTPEMVQRAKDRFSL